MTNNIKKERFTSPKGIFRYPRLGTPDTKFKPEGEYSNELVLQADSKEAQTILTKLKEAEAACLADVKSKAKTPAEAKKWEIKNHPYRMLEDDDGNETGELAIKFTAKASGVSKKDGKKWERKVPVFDAVGTPLTDVNVGGGSIGKISYTIIPYATSTSVGAGIKLALEAVQVVELKEFGTQNAKGFGFEEEEGYTASAKDDFGDAKGDDKDDAEDF